MTHRKTHEPALVVPDKPDDLDVDNSNGSTKCGYFVEAILDHKTNKNDVLLSKYKKRFAIGPEPSHSPPSSEEPPSKRSKSSRGHAIASTSSDSLSAESEDAWPDLQKIPRDLFRQPCWDKFVAEIKVIKSKPSPLNDKDAYRVQVLFKMGILGNGEGKVYVSASLAREKLKDKMIEFFFKKCKFY
ncbi:hypothetical protein HDU98_011389 [Podochytrium sp. JEL0797]|nr:hypothetical protein HDU98_011389 [Podochytrium sp. JEL0797]